MRTFHDPGELVDAMGIPFSAQQLRAITAPLEPAVVIAGAGSGKTTVMAARVVWLVGTGQVRPDQVLGLTFTRKAAAELGHRVRAALLKAGVITAGVDEQGEEVVMTYDSFAGRLVTEHGSRIGVENASALITGAARYRLASRAVNRAPGPFQHASRLRPDSLTERVLGLEAMMSSHLVTAEQIREHALVHERRLDEAPRWRGNPYKAIEQAAATSAERVELLGLVDDYRSLKNSLGVTEFADQMAVAAQLADQVPHVGRVLREQFRVVLLDEYQDTSSAQAQLLRALFSGDTPANGLGHPVTAVGDPFQAIYGWRGAAASNILAFHREFPRVAGTGSQPAAAYQLTVNRRSGPHILEVANDIAGSLRGDPVLLKHDPSGAQTPGALVAPDDRPGGVVRVASFDTWPEEVAHIADDIVRLHRERPDLDWKDFAVLLRRNADSGDVHQALVGRDVPVEIVGLGGLLGLPEVAEVVATLRLVNDVTANPELVRLLTGPRWRIGARDLALLGARARELTHREGAGQEVPDLFGELAEAVSDTDPTDVVSLLDATGDLGEGPYSPQARERFSAFAAEMARLRRHSSEPVLDQVRRVITLLGLDIELNTSGRIGASDQLAAFIDCIADYVDVDGDSSLSGLLAWFQAELDHGVGLEQATPSARDSVKLLTVHRAKGLEWEVVYLPALVDKTFPSDRLTDNWVTTASALPAVLRGDADSIDQLPESLTKQALDDYAAAQRASNRLAEDRLAYVGVTRAREELVATCHVWRPAQAKPKEASSYFTAVAAQAIEQDRVDHLAGPTADVNPMLGGAETTAWPVPVDDAQRGRRIDAAERVMRRIADPDAPLPDLSTEDANLLASWDATLAALEDERAADLADRDQVTLPGSLSVTQAMRLAADPAEYLKRILRPMPAAASRSASLGTQFHAWVESRLGQQSLLEPEPEDSTDDGDPATTARLAALQRAFEASSWAQRTPVALEVPFVLTVGDGSAEGGAVQLRGQIDAVYPGTDEHTDAVLVDWKTGRGAADENQLAIYRLAWARAHGLPVERVAAGFVYVGSGREHWSQRHLDEAGILSLITAARRDSQDSTTS
ncbi:ATP-dependent DNA helicase [Aestuariimicrobium sp. T2.26MG-19.2B]|uniref:ATP-dependent DNA helicase n=1 Tax=Aestuariimicrobium sp. T2.26MG-19.2B TaxID=3040679 RepID=UPI002477BD4F|nr:ATP-dependent DNA helicase [Aestuariimicrobium sp. T2.26MG-19.2B]CAI9410727.1 ATP-dependent DNA helicase Rep [Aestuariimicrobium sp. T2.26MG-19.2B]